MPPGPAFGQEDPVPGSAGRGCASGGCARSEPRPVPAWATGAWKAVGSASVTSPGRTDGCTVVGGGTACGRAGRDPSAPGEPRPAIRGCAPTRVASSDVTGP